MLFIGKDGTGWYAVTEESEGGTRRFGRYKNLDLANRRKAQIVESRLEPRAKRGLTPRKKLAA